MVASWPVTSSKNQRCFAFKKNDCEHHDAIVSFKIVAECKENAYIPMAFVHKREKAKRTVETCAKSVIEQFFDLRFERDVKTYNGRQKQLRHF